MKFDKVSIEHINLAIKDFKEKDYPDSFKASAYFDVEIEGELYPPKPIMAYANYHATGEEPTNNFSGGVDTPCFKAFERLGISIIKKTKTMSSNEELYKLKVDFLKEWPIDRLKTMTIEEYTNLEKTSFCYSLESKQQLLEAFGVDHLTSLVFLREEIPILKIMMVLKLCQTEFTDGMVNTVLLEMMRLTK